MDQQPTNRTLGNQGSTGITESLSDLVTWNTSDIPYRYCRSRRRTLCITVYPDLSVLVRVPMRAKPELIREFVLKHALWIIKTWRRIEARSASIPPAPQYTTGEMHAYLGQTYRLEVRSGQKASVAFLSGLHPCHSEGRADSRDGKKTPLSRVPY